MHLQLDKFISSNQNNCQPFNSSESLRGQVASYITVDTYIGDDEQTHKKNQSNRNPNRTSNAFFNAIQCILEFHCKSCDKCLYRDQVYIVSGSLGLLTTLGLSVGNETCSFCFRNIKNNKIPKINTKYNKLDPGKIPSILKGLSLMEKRLISAIHVFLTIIILPGGQYAEKGLAIDFPVSVEKNMAILPNKFKNCNIITVSYGENKDKKPTHLVRKKEILGCLKWLKANNDIYKNITIDKNFYSNMSENEFMSESEKRNLSEYEEHGVVNINYDIPDFDIKNILNNNKNHVTLPKCSFSPVNAYDLKRGEEEAFPYFFPYGRNGYNQERQVKLYTSDYFHYRLYFKDERFRKDIGYLLHAINFYEFQRLLNSVNIHMRLRKNSTNLLTASDIRNLDNNSDIINNSYMFMKQIRGTAAYWKNNLLNLLAMFKSLGPPSVCITLSANDMHWPDLIMTLKKCSYSEACKLSNAADFVKKDPLLTAIHFQRRFKALLKHVIYSPSQPLGKVVDHFVRVEFQNRGSPHMHMFFWIEIFSEIYNNQEKLMSYIDQVISTSSSNQYAAKFQVHSHSEYCLKKLGKCRFGFPYRNCSKTKLLNNIDVASEVCKGKFYELKRNMLRMLTLMLIIL